jgi:hypothetical protein
LNKLKTKQKARKPSVTTVPIRTGTEDVPGSFQVKDEKSGRMLTCPPLSASAMSGNPNTTWLERVLAQSMGAVPSDLDVRGRDRLAVEVAVALTGIAPRNTKEGMLAAQMLATHNVALEQLRNAQLPGQPLEMAQVRMNSALRLMRLFIDQMEMLARLQGNLVQQKVVVEHINVEAGGQAIVGAVAGGGAA